MTPKTKAIALVAAIAMLTACGTEDAPTGLQSGPQGRVRFVNLITDPARNPVNAILENLPFGVALASGASTPATLPSPATALYSPILTGSRTLVVKRTADTSVTLATINFTVTPDQDQTIYATGGTAGGTVASFITTDVNLPAPTATEARMRVVNLSPTAGPVDVFVTAPGADLTNATANILGLIPQTASANFTVAPGSYQVRFVPFGTAPAARNGAVVITIPTATYGAASARTFVAAENATGTGTPRGIVLTDR